MKLKSECQCLGCSVLGSHDCQRTNLEHQIHRLMETRATRPQADTQQQAFTENVIELWERGGPDSAFITNLTKLIKAYKTVATPPKKPFPCTTCEDWVDGVECSSGKDYRTCEKAGEKVCPECGGSGTIAEHHPKCDGYKCHSECPIPTPCQACQGSGTIAETQGKKVGSE